MAEIVKLGPERTRRARERLLGDRGTDIDGDLKTELRGIDAALAALRYRRLVLLQRYRLEFRLKFPDPGKRRQQIDERRDEKLAREIDAARIAMESAALTT